MERLLPLPVDERAVTRGLIRTLLTRPACRVLPFPSVGAVPNRSVARARTTPRRRETRATDPTPGWKGIDSVPLVNSRAPSVPANLIHDIREYFTGCAVIGLLAAQQQEPDMKWITKWSMKQGEDLARQVKRQWRKSKRRAS